MKSVIKFSIVLTALLACQCGYSQSTADRKISKVASAPGTSVALGLKNLSSSKVTVFAGPKDELANCKSRKKVYEGQSTNTVYASVNEVVCILGTDDKPVSCIDVMPNAAELEIDNAGTTLSLK